jgi:hypothetical protein
MLPHVANMHPKTAPRAPHPDVFIHVAAPRTPVLWEPWLRVVARRGDATTQVASGDAFAAAA